MKIKNVELFLVASSRWTTGSPSRHGILRLRSEDGIEGLGELSDLNHMPLAMQPDLGRLREALRGVLVGKDAFRIRALTEAAGAACGSGLWSARMKSAVDMALHDLVGRALGVPVYVLLGGKRRERIPVCFPIGRMRSMDEVENRLERVAKAVERGFHRIRLYCGGDWDADEAFLSRLRDEYGSEVELKSLDLSGRLRWKDSVRFLGRMKQYDYDMAESVGLGRDDLEGIAEVRRRADVPISEHVADYRAGAAMVKAGAVDVFNVATYDLGIRGALSLFELAHGAGLQALHGTTQELSIGTAAAAHVCAAAPAVDLPCDPAGPQLYVEDVVKERVQYENSEMIVPDGPGLGVELDEDKLKELAGQA
jgi:muconate cycloisomerase